MKTIKTTLQKQVKDFQKWWKDNYTLEEIEKLQTDDPGYSNWDEIENYFKELLNNNKISCLDNEDQINLLFLIARNWDCGRMIAWLSTGKQLSNLGNLQRSDFIMLAKTLSKQQNPIFNDAKSQFVSSFQKFDELSAEIQEILLKFYNDKHEYTKRNSLITLGKLGYLNIKQIVEESWKTIDDEYHKMACLGIIDENIKDKELMKHYLKLADKEEGQYLKKYVNELRKNKNYR